MIRTIIEHDVQAKKATVKFEHNGVVHEGTYQLDLIIPQSQVVLAQMGLEFTEELQLRALDSLTHMIEMQIESGAIRNPLPAEEPAAPPVEEPEPTPTSGPGPAGPVEEEEPIE